MKTISEKDFDTAYTIIEGAFPVSERRTYQQMKQKYKQGEYRLYGYYEGCELLGVMMCWLCSSCLFIENFAVAHQARQRGIGSILLCEIKKQYPDTLIVLEVEKPYDEMSKRRIAFYERNGFILSEHGYLQPQINVEINEIPLLLMSYPSMVLANEFAVLKKDIFSHVYQIAEQ